MEKKECPEKSSSSEEELPRRDSGSSRNIDASKLIRLQGSRKLLVDNSIRELQYTKTGIFFQAEACVTNDTVYRELPCVSETLCDISHFFQEDDETEAEPLLFRAVPECQLSGGDIPSVSEEQESSEGQDSGDICSEENQIVSSYASKVCFEIEEDYKNRQFLGPEGNVDVELIDKSTNRYSVWFPTAGWYLWSATGLGFLVRDEVTVTIAFGSWSQHLALDLQHHEQWLVGGPLFDVTAEPEEAVAEIHLPHFISLQGEVDVSWFLVAHFKNEGMVLEHPARVEPFYAVLESPSFSLMGILLRIASGTRLSIPITSNTLIYYHPHPEDIKFHLYLVPSDALLTKAIDDEEDRFHGVRLQTSPPMEPLNFGSSYIVSNSANLKVMPKELKLSYRSPGEIQHFSKFYAGQMKEPIQLEITEKRHGTLVWDTEVKPVDLQLVAASAPPPFSGAAFVKENHRQLQARMGDLKGVLDDLQDNEVLTENEKELVEQEKTRQSKNEALLSMVEKKGDLALDVLFRSISERDPYLVSYLRQQNL
nr:caspase recruitment domain-containing protein 8 isoform X2 [Homo sapiens]XP_047294395.1 caspase recruitment domain-containing protein 8 isoform X2 [Homo sapiens]XP_047294396.1 caspase recruitment domain-containing protein 8 isoform X2 [Homo sapiens]XP_047294397.1 caspase recruitment domain-containing protein 8 isoform X2 [Homo sapiens]XP_047294398.1 caspase recruitment domain-containing protein 8 isoform X2 [Homo sapiens]XP_047294399.1 caspase recruitment domain-containing protein 8 isoform|eukprot:XP_006723157.1 caspase recruitment domain-containing protein 8 isoform X2 [Homo sapiens]